MRAALVVSGGVDRSGRERVTPAILWLIERLAARFSLVVYVLRYHRHPASYPLLGATVHDLGSPNGIWRQRTALLAAMRRDGPFDVVHGYMGQPAGLVAGLTARRLGLPAIVTLDSGEFVALPDIDYGLQRRRRHRLGLKLLGRLAAQLTVCSRYQEELARRHGFAAAVIPLGVDTRCFASSLEPPPAEPPWRFVHVASLNPVKDQATLLEAVRRLAADGLDVHLDVVGEDTLAGSAHSLAERLGLCDRVTFHGFQPTDRLVAFYRRAHLNVLSSRHEAANVTVLEAAACGLATVGTRVGYLADWTPERAVTVAPRDPAALADALRSLLGDPVRRASLAAAAREWTLAHDADWTADRFTELYRQVADGHPLRAF